jgi:hypothetical protein
VDKKKARGIFVALAHFFPQWMKSLRLRGACAEQTTEGRFLPIEQATTDDRAAQVNPFYRLSGIVKLASLAVEPISA